MVAGEGEKNKRKPIVQRNILKFPRLINFKDFYSRFSGNIDIETMKLLEICRMETQSNFFSFLEIDEIEARAMWEHCMTKGITTMLSVFNEKEMEFNKKKKLNC